MGGDGVAKRAAGPSPSSTTEATAREAAAQLWKAHCIGCASCHAVRQPPLPMHLTWHSLIPASFVGCLPTLGQVWDRMPQDIQGHGCLSSFHSVASLGGWAASHMDGIQGGLVQGRLRCLPHSGAAKAPMPTGICLPPSPQPHPYRHQPYLAKPSLAHIPNTGINPTHQPLSSQRLPGLAQASCCGSYHLAHPAPSCPAPLPRPGLI